MSSEMAIDIRGVSKIFRMYEKPSDRLKQFFIGRWRQTFAEFHALTDISFQIPRGSCFGILGRNGAGKSTLLQIIAGTLTPSAGQVTVHGKVAALLELGTGFNPDFTGRENIFLNSAILGISAEQVQELLPAIISFADIGDFLDHPVKTYSSGMMVRLAFAVAIHVDPDILIIDEALAVGDAKFQAKCFRKFQEFRDAGKTILFVTHSTELIVRHCDQAILLEHGRLISQGDPKSVSNTYLDMLFGAQARSETPESVVSSSEEEGLTSSAQVNCSSLALPELSGNLESRHGYNHAEFRWGNRAAEIVDCLLIDEDGKITNHFSASGEFNAQVLISFKEDVSKPIYALTIKTPDGIVLYGNNSRDINPINGFEPRKAGDKIRVSFSLKPKLITGHYLISLGVVAQSDDNSEDLSVLDRRYDVLEIFVANYQQGFGLADLGMSIDFIKPAY